MKTLQEVLKEAERSHVAVGHFNISDLVALKAVVASAREHNVPVLVGVSEGERQFMGVRQVAALVKSIRDEYDHPIFLNADHTHSLAKAEEAAKAGFDEILVDGSTLSFEENVKQTKRAVEAIKSINPAIVVEGEVGYIGERSSSCTIATFQFLRGGSTVGYPKRHSPHQGCRERHSAGRALH
jgi:fructose/tagatose bisphosphate aldolase